MKVTYEQLDTQANLSFVVKWYNQPRFTAPFHFHPAYELLWIIKSSGKLYAGNRVMNFSDGDMFFFGPGLAHFFHNEVHQGDDNAQAIVVQFAEDFMGEGFFDKPEFRKIRKLMLESHSGIKLANPDPALQKIFRQFAAGHEMVNFITLMQLLERWCAQPKDNRQPILNAPQKSVFKETDPSKIELVFKYVLDNFKGDVNSRDAASLACLNDAAFCRYFKRRTRKTFSQFVNEVRVTHATGLLLEDDFNVNQVCFESGFNNISYFNRQFKTIMKKTPLEYRKEFLVV
jgi:AraC-like DNA-binding protein/quercetin dioxygenase-like cupin family protein